MSGAPDVDVIVPVHAATRPVDRLAASILDSTVSEIRITFVCHNIATAMIATALGTYAGSDRIRLLAFRDDTRSPAGPFNHGLDAATAPFVVKVDSDDTLEGGAIDSWLELARRTGSQAVIARMVVAETGAEYSTPPTRLGRRTQLDPVRDRLSYRTSTMGLIATELFRRAPAIEGLVTGEDIEQSLRLWFSNARLALASRSPAYLVHGGADDRVTETQLSLGDEFAWLPRLVGNDWFRALPDAARRSIALKLIRVQLFGAVSNRPDPHRWSVADRRALMDAARALAEPAGSAVGSLSIADRRLLRRILDPAVAVETILDAAVARRRFGHPWTVLPSNFLRLADREAPPRLIVAFTAASRRGRRFRH